MKKGQTLRGEIAKLQGAPKQYKQGWTEFYKLKFFLTPDVLIPRPETEALVDEVLRIVNGSSLIVNRKKQLPISNYQLTIIEVGTGSGCIAISIAKNLPHTKIIATDLSKKALEVAEKNSRLHKVENQILFLEGDLLSAFQPRVVKPKPDSNQYDRLVYHTDKPDIIVANLPYIPSARLMYQVDPLVADFEPRLALDGGIDGFEIYRRLFSQIEEKFLRSPVGEGKVLPKAGSYPKYLIVEIDEEQGEIALDETRKYFPNAKSEIKKDLAKKDRILIVKF